LGHGGNFRRKVSHHSAPGLSEERSVYKLKGYKHKYLLGVSTQQDVSRKALNSLNRVEGQVRGIAKMIQDDRYCIEVVTQIEAARAALARIESDLLREHLAHCVHKAMNSPDSDDQSRVIEELIAVFRR